VAELWHTSLPLFVRIGIWGGAGILATLAAFLPRFEIVGFAVLFIGPFERFLSYLNAMVAGPNLMRLTAVAAYFLMSALVVLIAAWPEPTLPAHRQEEGGR